MSTNDLTFLVHMNGEPSAGRYKSLINAHISKKAHIQRKKRAQQADVDIHQPVTTLSPYLGPERSPPTSFSPLGAIIHEEIGRRVSPKTYIDDGSLDPFQTLGVKIDSRAAFYLSFGRNALESAIHNVGWRGWVDPAPRPRRYAGPDLLMGYSLPAEDLRCNEPARLMVTMYGVLAYCASGIAVITKNDEAKRDALRYATEGMKCMRQYLNDVKQDLNLICEDLIYRLFRAEVLAANHKSALTHGSLLKMVLTHKAKTSGLRLDILSNALYQNGHFMFSCWTRSIFDSTWVAEQYETVWNMTEDMFANEINFEEQHLHPCVKDNYLRRLFLLTKVLLLQSTLGVAQNRGPPLYQHYSLASKCEWLQIALMDYYLDHDGVKADSHNSIILQEEVDLCLVLATLYVLRHSKNDVFVQGRPLFRGSLQIFRNLHSRLCGIIHCESEIDIGSHAAALTFILYVLALAAAYVKDLPGEELEAYLCYQMLKQHLADHGIHNWFELLSLLNLFPFIEHELPQPHHSWSADLFVPG